MRDRRRELSATRRPRRKPAEGEAELRASIAAMSEPDRTLASRLHDLVTASAPALRPRTWYGMPAYAGADGKVVCFFQGARKFKQRYAIFGFSDAARLDDGAMWPTAFALGELTDEVAARLAALLRRAAG